MGRIVTSVRIGNVNDEEKAIRCDALVDTGASHLVLPSEWRQRLGDLQQVDSVNLELADQTEAEGMACGPVKVQIEGFRPIFTEVLFVDMKPTDGIYEPLVGYIVLEQSQAAVDLVGHRLVHVKHLDLKAARTDGRIAKCGMKK